MKIVWGVKYHYSNTYFAFVADGYSVKAFLENAHNAYCTIWDQTEYICGGDSFSIVRTTVEDDFECWFEKDGWYYGNDPHALFLFNRSFPRPGNPFRRWWREARNKAITEQAIKDEAFRRRRR